MLHMAMSDEVARRAWQRERKARQRRERREALADLPPMDEGEFMRCLEAAVREGKVPAMKLWDEISRRKAAERVVSPFDALDEFERRDAS
jgi:hypothetical protein